jgi:cellulose 1,4-beta-cellobiosidase
MKTTLPFSTNNVPKRLARVGVLACSLLAFAPSCAKSVNGQPRWTPTAKHEAPVAVEAMPVEASSVPASPNENPFVGAAFYVDPAYAKKVQSSAQLAPELERQAEKLQRQPTALWLDRIDAISHLPAWLADARAQGQAQGKETVPVLVVYNLPNRDCSAKASNGELAIEADGERRYRAEYIDAIAAQLQAAPEQKVAVVLEPDSLPNIISNLGVEKCAVSRDVYLHSVAYAISKLSLPNVSIYLDVAHAGWLGWEANQRRMAELVVRVLEMAGGPSRIRGFASNVSNYNALDGDWGKRLEPSNPAVNELAYVRSFLATMESFGITDKAFIVDTSRNGRAEIRSRWGHWCNIRGAGIGELPRVAPTPGVDAYFWVKPPGDSDGTSDPSAARFDESCASPDSSPDAPEAGAWFHSYFVELVKNANPAL